jgi:hypothetical protein
MRKEIMSNAIAKTESLQRNNVSVDKLVPNTENPNEMSDAEFNMLYDNIERVGVTDPILVRPIGEGNYKVIGGHHRLEVAKLIGFTEVPCTIIDDPEFDDDSERFQLIRHNVIRGKMSPTKFLDMYGKLSARYTDEVIQESMGFVNEAEFKKLVNKVEAGIHDPGMKEQFKQAKEELKTIDDLSVLLNSLFASHGDSLPYGYMFLDYGGKDSVWLRMQKHQKKHLVALGEICRTQSRSMDHILGGLIERIVDGELDEFLTAIVENTPEVDTTKTEELPTLDFLDE